MDFTKRIKRQVLAKPREFRAICHPGFERTAVKEFQTLGLSADFSVSRGAIDWTAKLHDAWKVLAFSRTCTRLLLRIESFDAENFGRLEKKARDIPWELFFPQNALPNIRVTCRKSRLYHTEAIAERLEKILEERLEANQAQILSEPQTLYVHFENDRCTVSVDLAGEPLYRRGFERHVEDAPLRDTLTAAILLEAGISHAEKLFDPMSGSGTFSSEAALFAAHADLWKTRKFSLYDAPFFSPAPWNFMTRTTAGISVPETLEIFAGDISAKAFETIVHNLRTAAEPFLKPIAKKIHIANENFFDLPAAPEHSLLVLNPPYGKRLSADVPKLYKEIGQKIRSDFSKASVAIMVPGGVAERALRLKPFHRIETTNGGIDVSVLFLNPNR